MHCRGTTTDTPWVRPVQRSYHPGLLRFEQQQRHGTIPHRDDLNQSPWSQLESKVRDLVRRYSVVWVMTGPLHESESSGMFVHWDAGAVAGIEAHSEFLPSVGGRNERGWPVMGKGHCVQWNPLEGLGSLCSDIGLSFGPHSSPPWHLTIHMYFSLVRGNPPRDLLLVFDDAAAFRWQDECINADWLPDDLPLAAGPEGFTWTFPLLIVEDSPWTKYLANWHPLGEGKTHYLLISLNGIVEVAAGTPTRAEWVPATVQ